MRLVLASASPRRADLLRAAGYDFDVRPADVDERVRAGEGPEPYARRLAEAKALRLGRHPALPVLAADTVVVVDGEVLGKPADPDDAARMLRRLSGRVHEVLTAVALIPAGRGPVPVEVAVERTRVEFRQLVEAEIAGYVATGEPMDKAGAYAVQGRAAGFVRRLEGSYSNVVGLPLPLVHRMLEGPPRP
jgi:septum formation protein